MPTQGFVFTYLCAVLLISGRCQKSESMSSSSGSVIFHGANQYDFSIVVDGGGQECFWQYADQKGYFYFSYEVQWVMGLQKDRTITATINAPDGGLIDTSSETSGQINFKTTQSGFYQLCLNNFLSHFGSKQIFISFGTYYDFDEEKETVNKVNVHLNDTVSAIQETTIELQNYVFHMWRYYNFARMHKGADYFAALALSNYVYRWSFTQSVVIVFSGVLQLYFLKQLFASTKRPQVQPSVAMPRQYFRSADRFRMTVLEEAEVEAAAEVTSEAPTN
ncbi:transmembrane emp24 domain-containing protein 6 [Pristis pectinata]|uniref:transmembrane emp24 domain-containing protein 6 n=1 Tax=Pristis pectinata TaxID=685728 RepID=UPI00223E30C3|nr:transmembrane emp24 domain-containing protein 6 [Pristis pectinata]